MNDEDLDRLLSVYEELTDFYERLVDVAVPIVETHPQFNALTEAMLPFPNILAPLREIIERELADVPPEEWPDFLRNE